MRDHSAKVNKMLIGGSPKDALNIVPIAQKGEDST